MDNAALIFRFGKGCGYCFLYTAQAVRTDDQDVLNPTVLKFIQDRQPVFGAFIGSHLNGEDFLMPIQIDPKNDVGSQLLDDSVIPDRVVNGIYVEYWM